MTDEKKYFNNNKIFNNIEKLPINQKSIVKTSTKDNSYVVVDISSHVTEDKITEFDKCVLDGVFSIIENGHSHFTVDDVVKSISFMNIKRPSKKQKEMVSNSINKLRHIDVTLDLNNDSLLNKNKNITKRLEIKSYLLPLEQLLYKSSNNKEIVGYKLIQLPVVFVYAKLIKQIINVDLSDLRLEQLHYSEETIVLLTYLIRRIEIIKSKNNKITSNTISLERYDKNTKEYKGLYYKLGYLDQNNKPCVTNWRNKKKKINDEIKKILNLLMSNKYIKSYYEITKSRGTIIGYQILTPT